MFGLYGHHKIKNNAIILVWNGIIVGYRIEYELVEANLRKNINLKYWRNEIISSVQSVLPNAQVDVFKNFYRLTVTVLPTLNEVQRIGRKIAANKHIGKHVTVHNYTTWYHEFSKSKKLFKRRKQSVKIVYLI
jgi:hypothetical protein